MVVLVGLRRGFRRAVRPTQSNLEVANKVADEVNTVDEVVEKIEEPIVESNAVESDSLNEPNENNEKTPKPVPKEEALEPDSVNTFWSQDPMTKKWSIEATIIRARNKMSYLDTDGIKEFPRNRRFLRPQEGPSKVDQVTNPQTKSNKGPKSPYKRRPQSRKSKNT